MINTPTSGRIVLAANEKNRLVKTGPCDWLMCRSATGDVFVDLKKRNKNIGTIPFTGAGSHQSDDQFDSIYLNDKSGSENTVEFWFGRGKYQASQTGINVRVEEMVASDVAVTNQPTVTVDDDTPVEVNHSGEITINDDTPVEVNHSGEITINDDTPVEVNHSSPIPVDDTTPIRVDLTSGSVTLNQSNISNGGGDLPDQEITGNTTEQVITGAAANVRVRIGVPEDNTQSVRIGTHSAVDSDTGTIIPPGGYWESETAADVYVHMLGATAESVTRELETRS